MLHSAWRLLLSLSLLLPVQVDKSLLEGSVLRLFVPPALRRHQSASAEVMTLSRKANPVVTGEVNARAPTGGFTIARGKRTFRYRPLRLTPKAGSSENKETPRHGYIISRGRKREQ